MPRPAGKAPVLLLHSQERGQALVEELGRAAQLKKAQGVPANVIPDARCGIPPASAWTCGCRAVAFGASQVVRAGHRRGGAPVPGSLARADGGGAGHPQRPGLCRRALHVAAGRFAAGARPGTAGCWPGTRRTPAAAARFAVAHGKARHAGTGAGPSGRARAGACRRPSRCPPAGRRSARSQVNKDKCTLCLSCVGACPASALQDNPQLPQLRFIEKNCVQCGLCATTCPEDAITLQPRLLLTPERKEARVLNETPALRLRALRQAVRHAQGASSRCWASWPAIRCSRARRWSA